MIVRQEELKKVSPGLSEELLTVHPRCTSWKRILKMLSIRTMLSMYISYWSIKDHIWTWECTVARWRISSWWLLTRRVPDCRLRGRNCTGCSFGRTSCRIASRGYACGDDLRCCGWGEAWRDVWCHWEFVHVGRSTVRTVWWVYVGPFICFWLRRVQEQNKTRQIFKVGKTNNDDVPLPVYEPVDPILDWSHAFISTGSVCCNGKIEKKKQSYILLNQKS